MWLSINPIYLRNICACVKSQALHFLGQARCGSFHTHTRYEGSAQVLIWRPTETNRVKGEPSGHWRNFCDQSNLGGSVMDKKECGFSIAVCESPPSTCGFQDVRRRSSRHSDFATSRRRQSAPACSTEPAAARNTSRRRRPTTCGCEYRRRGDESESGLKKGSAPSNKGVRTTKGPHQVADEDPAAQAREEKARGNQQQQGS